MAEKFGITRSYYGELEGAKRDASDTLKRMLALMEVINRPAAGELDRDRSGVVREESPGPYGTQPTREVCEAYFRARLEDAEGMRERGGFAVLYSELVKHIPPDYLDHLVNLPDVDLGEAATPESAAETESRHRKSGS